MPNAAEEAVVTIDPDSGEMHVYAQELDEDGNVVREWEDTPEDFGRIAAQTAKQVILQRIREAERDIKYEEYAGREGDIVTGIIQQKDQRYTLLDLGRVEALLPQAEQGRCHRPRLSAVAGHREGGPERPPGGPPHRMARRHQERDPAGRRRGLRQPGVGRGRVGRERVGRAGVEAGRGRRGRVR